MLLKSQLPSPLPVLLQNAQQCHLNRVLHLLSLTPRCSALPHSPSRKGPQVTTAAAACPSMQHCTGACANSNHIPAAGCEAEACRTQRRILDGGEQPCPAAGRSTGQGMGTGSRFCRFIAQRSAFTVKPNEKGASLSGNDSLERTPRGSERSQLHKDRGATRPGSARQQEHGHR